MKSNFNYLQKQLQELKYNNDHDIHRYLRDLEFLFKDVEKKLYIRDLISATYPTRMIWDLSKEFIRYIIKNSNNEIYQKWNKNINKVRESREKAANYNGTKYNDNLGYMTILGLHPYVDGFNFKGIRTNDSVNDIFNELNKWMHYSYDKNYKSENNATNSNDKSTLFSHRNQVRYSEPSVTDIINYLETLWYVLVNIMVESEMFEEFYEYKFDFDRSMYNTPYYTMSKLLSLKHIDDLVKHRRECPICNEGNFNRPNLEELNNVESMMMPFGAYIECNHCNAKVDKTLKVKMDLKNYELEDSDCSKCKSKGSLQKRYSLSDKDSRVYVACNKCSWNTKSQVHKQDEEILKDIWEDIEMIDEDYNDW